MLIFQASIAFADETESLPKFKVSGLLDLRFISTDPDTSWLDRGIGKMRYGAEEELVRLSQASAVLNSFVNESLSMRLHVNVDADPGNSLNEGRFDIIEAFAGYRPVLSPESKMRFRAGFFFPFISLEHRDLAWTSPFSITPSAINSWIGEEVRVTGVETTFVRSHRFAEYAATLGLFGNNDPAGTLLAWRGWSLQDRQTGFTDQLPLQDIPALQPNGLFPDQPLFVEPFREVDGRIGFYGGASVTHKHLHLNALYYNNRGRPEVFDGVQYAWNTDFINIGGELSVGSNFEILSQFLNGSSIMGLEGKVQIRFQSAYVLASATSGPYRISVRYDDFRVKDRDAFQAVDDSNERGHSWMIAGAIRIGERHSILAETMRIRSDRAQRNPNQTIDWQFQTALRLRF